MKLFYVYLDIDGVLNTDVLGQYGKIDFDKVQILNTFLSKLRQHKYDPVIVISSGWGKTKETFEKLNDLLFECKLNYHKKLLKTEGGVKSTRGYEIEATMVKYDEQQYFVIIDDDLSEIGRFYPKHHIINPEHNHGLTQKNVDDFFKNNLNKIENEIVEEF